MCVSQSTAALSQFPRWVSSGCIDFYSSELRMKLAIRLLNWTQDISTLSSMTEQNWGFVAPSLLPPAPDLGCNYPPIGRRCRDVECVHHHSTSSLLGLQRLLSFNAGLLTGIRPNCRPLLHFKDNLKANPLSMGTHPDHNLERPSSADNRCKWWKACLTGVQHWESPRRQCMQKRTTAEGKVL